MECKLVLQPRPPSVIALSSRCTHQCLPVWAFIPRLELSVCHAYCLELHSCFPIHKLIPYLQGDRRAFMAGCWAIGVECVRTHFFEGLTLQQFFIIFWVVKALQEFVPSICLLFFHHVVNDLVQDADVSPHQKSTWLLYHLTTLQGATRFPIAATSVMANLSIESFFELLGLRVKVVVEVVADGDGSWLDIFNYIILIRGLLWKVAIALVYCVTLVHK